MDTQINNKEETDFNDASNNPSDDAKPQEKELSPDQIFDPEMPRMIRWVIKYSGGLVKDEKQANYVLLIFTALAIIFSLFFLTTQMNPKVKPMSPELINEMKKMFPTNIQ